MRATSRWTKWDFQEDDLKTGTRQDEYGIFKLGPARIKMGPTTQVAESTNMATEAVRPFVPYSIGQKISLQPLETLWW